tara:strand:+ start:172 stop:1800 length:1629 start_codon:yes stop_codon:yes gene_type:complete
MTSKQELNFLDCTFRDGGYYNQWDFPNELIDAYLTAIEDSKIDVVEIGFRFMPKEEFLGALAYSTDDFLNSLSLPKEALIAVMVNAKELINYSAGPSEAVHFLFNSKDESPVDVVRIAAHFDEFTECKPIIEELSLLGYRVGLNLMQAGGKTLEEIEEAAKRISEWDNLEVLYFADSLGNLNSDDVISIIRSIRSGGWDRSLGIHTHDNKGEALKNTMTAIDNGITWIDSTILGMGRGPGNARTEYVLLELIDRGIGDYSPDSIFQIVLKEFTELRNQYRWGPNLLYYLSANFGVHPTYVQEMSSMIQVDSHDQISALKFLGESKASGYSKKSLEDSFLAETSFKEGTWSCENWLKDETVLLVGPGPGTKKYGKELSRFIIKEEPKVISLNINSHIDRTMIDAYAACHHSRVLIDFSKYLKLKRPLVIPHQSLPEELKKKLDNIDILDYGMSINRKRFDYTKNGCVIPKPLVFAYLLALVNASGAKRILLAGFDGFTPSDPRQLEMEDLISLYKSKKGVLNITAITPTTYNIHQSSVYNPKI